MDFNVLSTQNWSRAFNVWIEDIQVVCHPVVAAPQDIQHSLLRKIRTLVRYPSLVVMLFFTLHCTRPQAVPVTPLSEPAEPTEDSKEPVGGQVYAETGEASWYGGADGFAGRETASGEPFNPQELTCAHRTLPFGTRVEVRSLATNRKVILRVNDRGPFVKGRMLDVSEKAAHALGMQGVGTARVRIKSVDAQGRPAPLDADVLRGNPYTIQVAALRDPGNIQRLSQELLKVVGPVNLQEAQTKGGVTVKRVRVGSFDRLEDAQRTAEEIALLLKGRGLDPFITREH
ncbi:septal ring lytic transglycosylase RlpA family protein [Mesoterricola sediminis]|uniref:Probable endolytic peptidoglycan transglycosylase RlpA n=1 Tax=Mesoterricola sediminis TaxID=2927980 RepID=A0AA48KCA9_9BACT|nr:septal ring lytic transglycosylase RlpA family protein [Mesoterricola sediminis]BDU75875.1 hypothetical protein METESE_08330 [Mesoterricola sediminis]